MKQAPLEPDRGTSLSMRLQPTLGCDPGRRFLFGINENFSESLLIVEPKADGARFYSTINNHSTIAPAFTSALSR